MEEGRGATIDILPHRAKHVGSSKFRGSAALMRSILQNLKRKIFLNALYYKLYSYKTDLIQHCKLEKLQIFLESIP